MSFGDNINSKLVTFDVLPGKQIADFLFYTIPRSNKHEISI